MSFSVWPGAPPQIDDPRITLIVTIGYYWRDQVNELVYQVKYLTTGNQNLQGEFSLDNQQPKNTTNPHPELSSHPDNMH